MTLIKVCLGSEYFYLCLVLVSKKFSNPSLNKQTFTYRLKWSNLKEHVGG